jgi:hypothetical protein
VLTNLLITAATVVIVGGITAAITLVETWKERGRLVDPTIAPASEPGERLRR